MLNPYLEALLRVLGVLTWARQSLPLRTRHEPEQVDQTPVCFRARNRFRESFPWPKSSGPARCPADSPGFRPSSINTRASVLRNNLIMGSAPNSLNRQVWDGTTLYSLSCCGPTLYPLSVPSTSYEITYGCVEAILSVCDVSRRPLFGGRCLSVDCR